MQGKDAKVQPLQLAIAQHGGQPGGVGFSVGMKARHAGVGDGEFHPHQRQQAERASQGKNPRHANQPRQQRAQHQAGGKGQANGHANHRHGAGAVFFAGQVGQQRGDGGGNRPGALQGAAQGEGEQIMRAGRHKAAQGKYRQPAVNHLFAADAVGQHAQRQLQQGLRQPVAAQRQANPGGVVAAGQLMGVQGKHRQDKKHAQHAQGVDAGKPQACP